MFTALSNWRFFPASSIRVFSSRVYTRVRARGRRRSSSLSLCVERHPRLWMCVCPHLLASSYVRPGAGTRVDIFTERRRIYEWVECPNFFIFASLSLNTVVCVGVRVDVFLFFVCQVSKAFKKDKTLGLGFKVTRGLARFGRRRRHMASSSSSRVVVVVFCADGANCRSLEIDRSMNIYEQRVGGQKEGWRLRISKIICTKKKKYLKKNEKHSLKKLDVFSFGFTNKIIMSYNTSKFELINSNSNSIRLNFRRWRLWRDVYTTRCHRRSSDGGRFFSTRLSRSLVLCARLFSPL